MRRVADEAWPESWGGLDYFWRVRSLLSADTLLLQKHHHFTESSLTLSQACHVLESGLYLLAWLSGLCVMSPALGGPFDFFTS